MIFGFKQQRLFEPSSILIYSIVMCIKKKMLENNLWSSGQSLQSNGRTLGFHPEILGLNLTYVSEYFLRKVFWRFVNSTVLLMITCHKKSQYSLDLASGKSNLRRTGTHWKRKLKKFATKLFNIFYFSHWLMTHGAWHLLINVTAHKTT